MLLGRKLRRWSFARMTFVVRDFKTCHVGSRWTRLMLGASMRVTVPVNESRRAVLAMRERNLLRRRGARGGGVGSALIWGVS